MKSIDDQVAPLIKTKNRSRAKKSSTYHSLEGHHLTNILNHRGSLLISNNDPKFQEFNQISAKTNNMNIQSQAIQN